MLLGAYWLYCWQSCTGWTQRWSVCVYTTTINSRLLGEISDDRCVVVSLPVLPQANSALISVWFIQPQLTVVYLVKSALISVWFIQPQLTVVCLVKSALISVWLYRWQFFTWWNQCWSVCDCIVDSLLHDQISVDQCVIVSLTVFYMLKSALISVWLHRWQSFTWWNLRWSMCGCIVDSLLHDEISVDQCVVVLLTVFYMIKSALISVWLYCWQLCLRWSHCSGWCVWSYCLLTVIYLVKSTLISVWLYHWKSHTGNTQCWSVYSRIVVNTEYSVLISI